MPRFSVVIPCFNQGEYVNEAIASVLNQSCDDYEIIVVDDGSTDQATVTVLDRLDHSGVKLVRTSNQGLAAARNNGITAACAEFILPLDADDRIGPAYLERAGAILGSHPEVGFVYCLAELFDGARGKFYLNNASLEDMLWDSRVFCSALFRKSDWAAVGGYNSNMVYGWEDWDFWLSLLELGKTPYMIEEVMFFYRVKHNSMIRSMTLDNKIAMHQQLYNNHRRLYGKIDDIDFEKYHRRRGTVRYKLIEHIKKLMFNARYWNK
ncbi:glycosyltransferase family 2 protein [Geobacter sulfurreducens]|uniref:Glycosyltransferase n=1 Tax=Geobacter sulfurreducens (strain ATCC 51573 / DSM 12127 / PCA) TaxID=243231 RepID=Q74CL7_GEOSL|nr:glycosyltransferase family A protein [Geobacter sulfurreducens]AAR99582.1 glycosyltransferase [Geobacter sulfurreducens PCA]ADN78341.1 glycosyltransferase [Geobacter sulfurreducens KN400]QVW36682.1 glycosyltransferase family 2 protein [Geobacter sulfurreducens]UAC05521.1 glycosyltransferase family 2 protein [Geobacter sulfurreducens]HBB69003.1 glycosyltransferase family 2 protein [Geobacter sulfurreducens]